MTTTLAFGPATTIPATDVAVGDFLVQVNPSSFRGPRGGRYRTRGARVDSAVTELVNTREGLAARTIREPRALVVLRDSATAVVRRPVAGDED